MRCRCLWQPATSWSASTEISLQKCKQTNKQTHCWCLNSVVPASVDSDRQNVVVEALFDQAEDLRLRGDLSALQTLQAEQRDGGNGEHLGGRGRAGGSEGDQEERSAGANTSAFSPLARPWGNGWWRWAGSPCCLGWGSLLLKGRTGSQRTPFPRRTPSWNADKLHF